MRKLVSIQKISNVTPIFNADLIEVVTINGWKIVVKKDDNFKIGNNVVYFEIDSALPLMDERFSFLHSFQSSLITRFLINLSSF